MDERTTWFVDLILPVPIRNLFTYRVPFELNDAICIGQRVIVPFRGKKRITGVIANLHNTAPSNYTAKYVDYLLDEQPIISVQQIHFWQWISEYYLAPIGDVMAAALPANFKLASETVVLIHPDYDGNLSQLTPKEELILNALAEREKIELNELAEITETNAIALLVKKMIDKGLVITQEEINQRYTPKTKTFFRINPDLSGESIAKILDEMASNNRLKGSLDALLRILQCSKESTISGGYVAKKKLLENNISTAVLKTLEKKGIILQEKLQIDRFGLEGNALAPFPQLTEAQHNALLSIEKSWETKNITLLHGITGSGKTEIYMHLIQSFLDLGKQVLFLIPEIALTTQLISRLQKYFGELVGVYHSKFNQNERVEIWQQVQANLSDKFRVIVGARSSIFLPFKNLGLVIVDEEHEATYKQNDPSPRYHGRDAAIYLARSFGAKVILGSATPSLESYQNAKDDKYGLVHLQERFLGMKLPSFLMANLRKEKEAKTMVSHFSSTLLEEITTTLAKKEQVILFQNRRGYTPYWTCEVCSWIPKCHQCDVSLTYHLGVNMLKCHYCGFSSAPMGSCGACGSNKIKMQGFGTEKIEDELQPLFPLAHIERMDFDTTRSKSKYAEILQSFEDRKIDILIGTQMLAKGLDFDHVGLVGILDAEQLLNAPNFRAYERGFQLMTQVSGRAGRKHNQGKVVIQTRNPDHWILQLVVENATISFIEQELMERLNYQYPPFYKLININLKHEQEPLLVRAASDLSNALKKTLHERVIGPEFPLIKRLQGKFQQEIKVKYEKTLSDKKIKEHLMELLHQFYENTRYKKIKISIDVDPY
jgi:primosomal protein N' (replication factor Y)